MCEIVRSERLRKRIMVMLRQAVCDLREGEPRQFLIDQLRGAYYLRYGDFPPLYLVGKPMSEWGVKHATVLGRAIYNLEGALRADLENSIRRESHGGRD